MLYHRPKSNSKSFKERGMDLANIFLLNLAFPLFFELSLCQTDCNGCCDPSTYRIINEPRRSIKSILKQGQKPICDISLSWGWYRFTSYAGGKMPTSRVNPYQCGTVAPIWLRGKHPSAYKNVTVQACTNFFNLSNGCYQPFDVQIRKCSGSPPFFVYYLRPTYACEVAYCAGKDTVYSDNRFWYQKVLLCCMKNMGLHFLVREAYILYITFRTSSLSPWGEVR